MGTIKAICDGAAAILALAAGIAWYIASRHPVTLPEPAEPAGVFAHPAKIERKASILRGVQWNRRAAFLTSCSAFAMFLSWALPHLL